MRILMQLWLRTRTFLAAVLIAMILMRLIWVDVREHSLVPDIKSYVGIEQLSQFMGSPCRVPPSMRGLTEDFGEIVDVLPREVKQGIVSQGFLWLSKEACRDGEFKVEFLVRRHQNLILVSVLFAAILARIISGSWFLSILVSAVLLSRGRYLSTIGYLAPYCSISMGLILIFTLWSHFIRTGYWLSLLLGWTVMTASLMFDSAFFLAGFSFVIFLVLGMIHDLVVAPPQNLNDGRYIIKGVYRIIRDKNDWNIDPYLAGRPTVPLGIPITRWLRVRRRWFGFGLVAGVWAVSLFVYGLSQLAWTQMSFWRGASISGVTRVGLWLPEEWARVWWSLFDLDLFVASVAIGFGLLLPRKLSLPGFFEVAALFLLMFSTISVGAMVLDLFEYSSLEAIGLKPVPEQWFRARSVIFWFEPLFLVLGALGIVNFIRVFSYFLGIKNQ